MLGSEFKRGVTTTLERVFKSSDWEFNKLEFQWYGTGAAIQFTHWSDRVVDATFRFPNVDDNVEMPRKSLPKFIAMALHELGHAWFTENTPWDAHRDNPTLCRLINGLEDPRIEQAVIDSGIAGNAHALFENLINDMMDGTYVDPNDFGNIAFQLAVEGRRLNGYKITVPPVIKKSRYREPMEWALSEAHFARSTEDIVAIAVELFKRLNVIKETTPPPPPPPPDEPEDDGEGEGEDDGEPGDPTDDPADDPAEDGEPEGEGDDGSDAGKPCDDGDPGDEPGDDSEDDPEGDPEDEGDEQVGGKPDAGEREFEPDLSKEMARYSTDVDTGDYPRPTCEKPIIFKFNWS